MKNPRELSFHEMDALELREVEGGSFVLGSLIVATFVAVISDWDNFKHGLMGKPEIA